MTDVADDPIESSGDTGATEITATPEATPEPAKVDHGADLADLLRQWKEPERTAPHAEPVAPQPHVPLPDPRAFSDDDILKIAMQADTQRVIMTELLHHQQAQEWQRREAADSEAVLREAETYLDGMAVPPDFAKRWLWSEYAANPALKQSWDQRYSSEEAKQHAQRMIGTAFKKMRAEAKLTPDPDATTDRAMVTAAVRGASREAPPAENQASYNRRVSNMSDAEMRDHVRQQFGFTPSI